MIPPSIWLRAPSGLITRPTSWIATTFSTTTSPVPMSTATSASWIPNVSTRMPVGLGPRAPLPRIWPSPSRPVISASGHEPPSEETIWPPFSESSRSSRSNRCAASSITCRAASAAADRTAGPIDGSVEEPPEIDGERAARRVADLHLDLVERQAELLGRDHRHRRAGARADVLHRRDDVRAAVRAEPHPRVARRAAAAVPDLARHPHAALPDLVRAGAHLVAALPVRLGAPVALHQALRRVRTPVHRVGVRVVELPQLERIDADLRRELVEHALERPRSLDEARRAEGGHRRQVQLRAVLDRADVVAGVEQLRRAGGRRQPAVPAERARVLAAERRSACRRRGRRPSRAGSSRCGCPRSCSRRAASARSARDVRCGGRARPSAGGSCRGRPSSRSRRP